MKESGGDRMLAQNLPAMAAPSSSAPEPTADTVTPPRPSSSAGGNPSKPFRSNATNTPVIRPPIFPPQPLLGKPLNPSAAPSPSHGVLYPVGATAHRGFNVRSAGGGRSTDQLVSVANPAGYLRSSSPMAVMNFAAAVAAASQARPYVYGGADHAMAVAALAHGMRPPPPQGQQQSYQSAVPRPGPPRGASLPAKVVSVPVNPLVPELSDTKER
ncbi:hypothetical protein AXF42_Ash017096 [Apostasia shenzhenica]|uniref:Uncharacterized protein n=1 Tax=Apostasia shenzhenica TaxID=1088818 RepID=A0A2H9ZV20_9ASPA|nr:hypothetical protein AXF42_Ash017096 [Apostasia shenzhenica]